MHVPALRQAAATAEEQKEAVQTAFAAVQTELEDLEGAAVAVCQELEGGVSQSGSSTASRLRALGSRLTKRVKDVLFAGVQRTLGVLSTHYVVDLPEVAGGYVIAEDATDEEALAIIEQADAAAEDAARSLCAVFERDLFPGTGADE